MKPPASSTGLTLICMILLASLLSGCKGITAHRGDLPDDNAAVGEVEDGEGTDAVALLLFPINVVPNIIVNTGGMLFHPLIAPLLGQQVSNIWPIVTVIAPIAGPYQGIADAIEGRPFWDTWAVRDYRTRDESTTATTPEPACLRCWC